MAEMRTRRRRVFVEQSENAIVVKVEQSGLRGLLLLWAMEVREGQWLVKRRWLDFCRQLFLILFDDIWSGKLVKRIPLLLCDAVFFFGKWR